MTTRKIKISGKPAILPSFHIVGLRWRRLLRGLRVKCQHLVVEVAKESHPEIVVGHFGDQVRLGDEGNTASIKGLEMFLNVVHFKINYRTRIVKFGLFRCGKNKADASAIKESHITGAEQE